ncbi:899_t:CDS:10, partial [Paraglomus occultum]
MFAPRASRPLTVAAYSPKNGGLRRRKKEQSAPVIELERILGFTTFKPTALASAPSTDLIAYAAGAVVVLYNHKKNKQVGFLYASSSSSPSHNLAPNNRHTIAGDALANQLSSLGALEPNVSSSNNKKNTAGNRTKAISCLTFSPDGAYLIVGECGHQPRILIWEVQSKTLVNELKGHKYGILALSFSPNMKYIVSIGFQHDGYINVWNWKQGTKLACNKITTKVHTLAFNRTGSFFVTAGLRHVKFWYFDSNGLLSKKPSAQKSLVQVLDGRSGILGDLRDNNFVDAVCCKKSDNTYLVTSNGRLCMFTDERLMDKWVDLQVTGAFSLDVSDKYIICACTNGIVRLFEPITLKYLGTLPKPHPLGVDLTTQTGSVYHGGGHDDTYPDTVAIKLDGEAGKLTCIYSDRSLFIWDIKDVKKIGKYRSFLYHCANVWGVEMIPIRDSSNPSPYPEDTFITYSADNTVRFWSLDRGSNTATSPTAETTLKRNIFSKDCLRIAYVDPDGNIRMSIQKEKTDVDHSDPNVNGGANELGIRTLKISPDGKLLASGDKGGNLSVYDLDTFEKITYQEAHEAEILTIEFTDGRSRDSPYLIATASRDRILHIFDIKSDFRLIQTLDDHSSSITAIKFTHDGRRLISCGADKSIIFRARQDSEDFPYYVTYHNISGRATVFDMDIDISNRYIATVSGERRLNLYQIDSGKNVRSYKPDTPDEINASEQGSLLKVGLDPSGVLAVAAGSDRSIRLFDFANGTILSKVFGHSELITDVKFTLDCERIISTSADGCVFVWKMSDEWVEKMRQKWLERSGAAGALGRTSPVFRESVSPQPPPPNYRARLKASVRKGSGSLRTRKSFSSLLPSDVQREERLRHSSKRPGSYFVDDTKVHTTQQTRPLSEVSPSRIPLAASTTPSPPSSKSGSSSRRESWKLGLPSWAKKAFKEKEGHRVREKNDSEGVDSVSNEGNAIPKIPPVTNNLQVEKTLPAVPKTIPRVRSPSKLQRESTIEDTAGVRISSKKSKSSLTAGSPKSVLSMSPPSSTARAAVLSTSPMSMNTVLSTEGEDNGEDDDDETSAIEETGVDDSAYEDAETIFVAQPEEADDVYINGPDIRRRRESFVEAVTKIDLADGRGSDKASFSENDNDDNDAHKGATESRKRRESYTLKFLSGGQSRDSSGRASLTEAFMKMINSGDNKALAIEEDEEDKQSDDKGSFEKTMEALEGRLTEVTNGRVEPDKSGQEQTSPVSSPALSESATVKGADDDYSVNSQEHKLLDKQNGFIARSNISVLAEKEKRTRLKSDDTFSQVRSEDGQSPLLADQVEEEKPVFTDEHDTVIIGASETPNTDKVGIVVEENVEKLAKDLGITVNGKELTSTSIFVNDVPSSFEDTELSEDAIADDVYNMSVLLERTLGVYKKVTSSIAGGNTKNESVQTLISASLMEMVDDIRKSLDMTKESSSTQEKQTGAAGKRVTAQVDADVEGDDDEECDADSSNSYATASTTLRDHNNRIECKSPESTNLLAPPSPASSPSGSALAAPHNMISDDSAQVLLEKYSDILVKMVQDKLSTKTDAVDKNSISSKSATLAQPKNNEKSFGSLRSKTKA